MTEEPRKTEAPCVYSGQSAATIFTYTQNTANISMASMSYSLVSSYLSAFGK